MSHTVDSRFVFRFRDKASKRTETVTVKNEKRRGKAYAEARNKISERYNLSIREFENFWSFDSSERHITAPDLYYNSKEIVNVLDNINKVQDTKLVYDERTKYKSIIYVGTKENYESEVIFQKIKKDMEQRPINEFDNYHHIVVNSSYWV